MVPDPALQGIALAAEHGTSIGITLYLPGMILSGMVVARKEWIDAYAQSIASGAHASGVSRDLITNWTVEQQAFAIAADRPLARSIKHIHLRDVNVFFAAETPVLESPFWRGEIASVVGWHFQQLRRQAVERS